MTPPQVSLVQGRCLFTHCFLCSHKWKARPVKTMSVCLAWSLLKKVHMSYKNLSKVLCVVKMEMVTRKMAVMATATETMAVMKIKALRAMMMEAVSLLPVEWHQVHPLDFILLWSNNVSDIPSDHQSCLQRPGWV